MNGIGRIIDSIARGWVGSSTLVVKPEALRDQSLLVSDMVKKLSESFSNIEMSVLASETYWNGDASEAFREKYEEYKDDINDIILRLTEHITDLNTMAGVYDEAEAAATEKALSLSDDVII